MQKARPFIDSILADVRTALLAMVTAEPPSSFPAALDRAGVKDLPAAVQLQLWRAVVDALASDVAPAIAEEEEVQPTQPAGPASGDP